MRILRELIFGLFAVIFITAAWFFLSRFLDNPNSGLNLLLLEFKGFAAPAVFFLLFGVIIGLEVMLVREQWVLVTTYVLSSLTFLLFFGINIYYIIGILFLFLFQLIAGNRIIKEKDLRIKFQVFRILRRGLPIIFTGISLIAAMAYYFSSALGSPPIEFTFPRSFFNKIAPPLERVVQTKVPEFRYDMSADAFMDIMVKVEPGGSVPAEIVEDVKSKAREKTRSNLSARFNIEVRETDTAGDVIYNIINSQINYFARTYRALLPLAVAFGFFLTLKALSIPFVWIIIFFSWIALHVLTATGAVSKQIVTVQKETYKI